MAKFKIFTDSCSDLTPELRKKLDIDYVHMNIVVDGEEKFADLDGVVYSLDEFYSWLKGGKKIKTNQVTMEEFINKFTPVLEKGEDILYLACSSALSGSINMCRLASEDLLAKFPERKIIAVDTLAGAMCEGLVVYTTAIMAKKNNFTIEEAAKWCEDNKFRCNQFATVDTLLYLKEAGRVSGASCFFGNIIGVKPVFISDRKGNNFVTQKVRGTPASLQALVQGALDAYEEVPEFPFVWVGHASAPDKAEKIKEMLIEGFKNKGVKCPEILIAPIGPIVGTTTGPGCLATFCFGKEVTRYEGDGINVK